MFSTPTPESTTRPSVRTPSSASNQYKKRWSKGTPTHTPHQPDSHTPKEDRLTPHQLTPAEVDVIHQSILPTTTTATTTSSTMTSGGGFTDTYEDMDMDMDMDMDCDTSFLDDDDGNRTTTNSSTHSLESPTKREFERALSEETLGASVESAHKSLKTKNRVPGVPSSDKGYAGAAQALYSGGSAPASKAACEGSRARGFFACSEAALRGSCGGSRGDEYGEAWGGSGSSGGAAGGRYVSRSPERILDAPELKDDYYLNLLDWSVRDNVLAVALGKAVYLWNADTGVTHTLSPTKISCGNEAKKQYEDRSANFGISPNFQNSPNRANVEDEYISSVRWMRGSGGGGSVGSQYLAIGLSSGTVQLWDCEQLAPLRSMGGHAGRVGALSWMDHLVASGSRDSTVMVHDVRRQQHLAATLCAHRLEVCGLEWSPGGQQLASGANDNALCVWDSDAIAYGAPRFAFTQHHRAAVKAVAWCPWQQGLLASGGGTADGCIRLWNTSGGACLKCVDTGAQVTDIVWSLTYREMVSCHGYSKNQLVVWKYPSMERVAELVGHERRVLCMARSPDSSVVASAGADETLRFWKIWPVPMGLGKFKMGGGANENESGDDTAFYSTAYKR